MNPETLKALAARIEAGEIGPEIDALIWEATGHIITVYNFWEACPEFTADPTDAFAFKAEVLPAWRLEFLQERRLNEGSQWSVSLVCEDIQAVARSVNPAAALTAACLRALAMEAGDE